MNDLEIAAHSLKVSETLLYALLHKTEEILAVGGHEEYSMDEEVYRPSIDLANAELVLRPRRIKDLTPECIYALAGLGYKSIEISDAYGSEREYFLHSNRYLDYSSAPSIREVKR